MDNSLSVNRVNHDHATAASAASATTSTSDISDQYQSVPNQSALVSERASDLRASAQTNVLQLATQTQGSALNVELEDEMQLSRIEVQTVGPALGAEIRGLDLTKPFGPKLTQKIDELISKHLVVVIKGQKNITPQQQVAFTEHFGAVEPHPLGARKAYSDHMPPAVLVVKNPMNTDHKVTIRNDYWHSDLSCMEQPVSLSVLRALEIPGSGWGDTMFCNMYKAYDALTPGMKHLCNSLNAVHNTNHYFDPERTSETFERRAENVHPVVRTHPKTGKNGLFLSHSFIDRFEGMTFKESRPLLDQLIAHCTQPHNVYRHRWEAGDMVVWDNRCTMHYAVFDYQPGQPRHLQRTTASGERPFKAS